MTQLTGYKRWTLNLGLLILATLLFMSALLSTISSPSVLSIGFMIIFGGFVVVLFTTFIREVEDDKGVAKQDKRQAR